MLQTKNPAPLAGGNRAGYRIARRLLDNTAPAADQSLVRRLRRHRRVELLCRTPRLVDELLAEIGRHHGIADDIERRITAYAAIDPAILATVGGDQFPAAPLRLVAGDGDGA